MRGADRIARAVRLAALLLACALATAAHARPKVCLVLSGGGARGAAHVGVIKVLQEMRVPIDCITGTSMGSIVGAAYASGTSTAEMEKVISEMSLAGIVREKPPRQDLAFRIKEDDRTILLGPELGLTDKLEVIPPKGIVSGVALETVLRRLSKVQGYRRFDELAIPFRAVATDLVTGKPVVFSDGDLANVMRASMSVPGVIAPAEIEGRLLIDGGLTDNLPVDVARRMGADIVIAVNLGTPLLRREELTSLIGVTAQMVNILTEQNVQASLAALKPTDILILPELGGFSAGDFDHMMKTVPIGEAAARKVAERLAALAETPAAYAEWRREHSHATPPDTRPVDEIRFTKMERVNAEAVGDILETKVGEPLDQAKVDRDMRRLYGIGDFEHVNYRILEEAGKRALLVDAIEKSWGPNYLRFGLGLASDLQGDAYFNLAASYKRTWVNSLGAEWRTDFQMGRDSHVISEFYQPLQTSRYLFVAPRIEFNRESVDLYQVNQRVARYNLRSDRAALDFGTELTKYGEMRLGVLGGHLSATLETGPPELQPEGRVKQGAITFRAALDQLDNARYPRFGTAATFDVFASQKGLGATDQYKKWDASFLGAYSFGPHTLQLALRGGGEAGSDTLPRYDLFQWGGLLQQSGYRTGALVGERLRFARVVYMGRIAQQQLFDGLYGGISLEAGKMQKPLVPGSPTGLLKSVAVFFSLDTLLGPLYLGYGWAADGNRSAYLYLGQMP
jgi:NTE family protein